jgi:hypothetical protein
MIELSALELACLKDLAGGPLVLSTAWNARAKRREVVGYTRAGAGVHQGREIRTLGKRGFVEPSDDFGDFRITEAGRAWLAAHAVPAPG